MELKTNENVNVKIVSELILNSNWKLFQNKLILEPVSFETSYKKAYGKKFAKKV